MIFTLHCYQYVGLMHGKTKKKGRVVARSETQAAKQLMENGLVIYSIKKVSDKKIFWLYTLGSWCRFRMSQKKFMMWWMRELADMMTAGFSLRVAMEDTIYKAENEYHKVLLYQIYQQTISGHSFFSATKKMNFFSESESAAIRAAEKNRCLPEALLGMHRYLSQKETFKAKQSVMTIPLVIFIMITLLSSNYLVKNVLPFYVFDLWLQNKAPVFSARIFLSIYSGNLSIRIILALGIFLIVRILYLTLSALPIKKIMELKEKILLHIPIVKTAIKRQHLLHFLSSLAFSLKAKLPLHQAFLQASEAVSHHIFKQELLKAYHQLYDGISLESALSKISLLDAGDRLVLQTCLSNYGVDNESITQLLDYTYLRLQNFQMFTGKLLNTFLLALLIFLILFLATSLFNIIILDYL